MMTVNSTRDIISQQDTKNRWQILSSPVYTGAPAVFNPLKPENVGICSAGRKQSHHDFMPRLVTSERHKKVNKTIHSMGTVTKLFSNFFLIKTACKWNFYILFFT
jgi:hypothetical protein